MTKRLFLFIAIFVIFFSCKKKDGATYTYICDRYHQVSSDFEVLAIPTYLYAVDTLKGYNDGEITLYEQEHNKTDTTYESRDTVIYVHEWSVCNVE